MGGKHYKNGHRRWLKEKFPPSSPPRRLNLSSTPPEGSKTTPPAKISQIPPRWPTPHPPMSPHCSIGCFVLVRNHSILPPADTGSRHGLGGRGLGDGGRKEKGPSQGPLGHAGIKKVKSVVLFSKRYDNALFLPGSKEQGILHRRSQPRRQSSQSGKNKH